MFENRARKVELTPMVIRCLMNWIDYHSKLGTLFIAGFHYFNFE